MVAVVEQTTLPRITAEAKQSEWTGYVNAYVTGRYPTDMANGSWRKDLWYLSYVLPKGQGAIGQAIANTFFSNTGSKSIAIEGIGGVALGSQRQDLQSLGYKVHWNYRMEPLGPDAIQCVVEPLMLTSFDPMLAETSNKKSKAGAKSGSGKKKNKSEVTSLSTAPASSSMEHQEAEITRREQKPMFLLLIPGVRAGNQDYLEQLHLAYLRKRCPFDLHEEWASLLWKRATEKNEVRELAAWSYVYEPKASPEDFAILSAPSYTQPKDTTPAEELPKEESPFQAVISQAFLCLPDIEGIHTSLLNTVLQREKEEVAA